ncbi:unnamed protein product [Hermetia illucens]|uniref:Uncharacterized protein n=1 Tax=Hermetia illucens TaxID=343691 RepID=A0A7R8UEM8_HERIL|nr:general odorant-binding protein 19d-like [Hermetia illucens]CAD7079378.1 unnamed protein product [Hermetia illucens]
MNRFPCVFVIVAVLVALTQADISNPQVKATFDKCVGSEKATPGDVETLKAHSSDLSKEAKCVIACVMKEFQVLADDGKINRDVYMKHAEEMSKGDAGKVTQATEMYDICSAKTVDEPCESAYNFGQCIKNEMIARNMPLDL